MRFHRQPSMRFVAGRRALAPLTGRWILDDRIGALQQ
jgi:hypothetical protein